MIWIHRFFYWRPLYFINQAASVSLLVKNWKSRYFIQIFNPPSISKSVSQSSSSLSSTLLKKSSPSGDKEPEDSLRKTPVGGLSAAY